MIFPEKGVYYIMLSPEVTALKRAPIAQLDRASGYGPEGLGFKSLWVYHFFCQNPGVLSLNSIHRFFFTILPDSIKFLPHQKNGNKHVGYKACRSKASTGCSIAFPVFIVFPAMPHGKQAFPYIKDRYVPILVWASPAT